MAVRIITYTYTGPNEWKRGNETINFSSFVASGDTGYNIAKIISVQATGHVHRYSSSASKTCSTSVEINYVDGAIVSNTYTATNVSYGGDVYPVPLLFSDLGTIAAKWGTVSSVTVVKSGGTYTNFTRHPLVITITFEDASFFPVINGFSGSRYNGSEPDDLGQQFICSFTPTTAKTTTESSADYPSYINYSVGGTVIKTLFDTRSGSTMSQINALIDSPQTDVIASSPPFSPGSGYLIKLNFCYHGEVTSQSVYIGKSFVNFHFSGATDEDGNEIGGVAVGQYSSVAQGTGPKFECNYPAFFDRPATFAGGIVGVTDYATGEVKTGGKFNGKDIYRTVITNDNVTGQHAAVGSLPAGTIVDSVLGIFGAMKSNNEWRNVPLIDPEAGLGYSMQYYLDGLTVRVQDGTNIRSTSKKCIAIILYTKGGES